MLLRLLVSRPRLSIEGLEVVLLFQRVLCKNDLISLLKTQIPGLIQSVREGVQESAFLTSPQVN